MYEHYQFTEDEWSALQKQGVTIEHLFKSLKIFDPYNTGAEITKICLYFYIDKKGDFIATQKFPSQKIAKAIFDKLPIKCKIEIAEYVALIVHGEDDE